jgi:hypothetical protein
MICEAFSVADETQRMNVIADANMNHGRTIKLLCENGEV